MSTTPDPHDPMDMTFGALGEPDRLSPSYRTMRDDTPTAKLAVRAIAAAFCAMIDYENQPDGEGADSAVICSSLCDNCLNGGRRIIEGVLACAPPLPPASDQLTQLVIAGQNKALAATEAHLRDAARQNIRLLVLNHSLTKKD
jgi:hypothetical protein